MGECWGEIMSGGSEEDEIIRNGDRLDGEIAREEGRMVEENMVEWWTLWWWREDFPSI